MLELWLWPGALNFRLNEINILAKPIFPEITRFCQKFLFKRRFHTAWCIGEAGFQIIVADLPRSELFEAFLHAIRSFRMTMEPARS
jgi:hypothetical protein